MRMNSFVCPWCGQIMILSSDGGIENDCVEIIGKCLECDNLIKIRAGNGVHVDTPKELKECEGNCELWDEKYGFCFHEKVNPIIEPDDVPTWCPRHFASM